MLSLDAIEGQLWVSSLVINRTELIELLSYFSPSE